MRRAPKFGRSDEYSVLRAGSENDPPNCSPRDAYPYLFLYDLGFDARR
jgi:hypothetical protein